MQNSQSPYETYLSNWVIVHAISCKDMNKTVLTMWTAWLREHLTMTWIIRNKESNIAEIIFGLCLTTRPLEWCWFHYIPEGNFPTTSHLTENHWRCYMYLYLAWCQENQTSWPWKVWLVWHILTQNWVSLTMSLLPSYWLFSCCSTVGLNLG